MISAAQKTTAIVEINKIKILINQYITMTNLTEFITSVSDLETSLQTAMLALATDVTTLATTVSDLETSLQTAMLALATDVTTLATTAGAPPPIPLEFVPSEDWQEPKLEFVPSEDWQEPKLELIKTELTTSMTALKAALSNNM